MISFVTNSLGLLSFRMTDTSKSTKTSPVLFPEEIVGNCELPENVTLKRLVESMRMSKTVYEQMNSFGVLKKEICRLWFVLVPYSGFQ